jgi:hypothetical protein
MPIVCSACMSRVPAVGSPKISRSVERSATPPARAARPGVLTSRDVPTPVSVSAALAAVGGRERGSRGAQRRDPGGRDVGHVSRVTWILGASQRAARRRRLADRIQTRAIPSRAACALLGEALPLVEFDGCPPTPGSIARRISPHRRIARARIRIAIVSRLAAAGAHVSLSIVASCRVRTSVPRPPCRRTVVPGSIRPGGIPTSWPFTRQSRTS